MQTKHDKYNLNNDVIEIYEYIASKDEHLYVTYTTTPLTPPNISVKHQNLIRHHANRSHKTNKHGSLIWQSYLSVQSVRNSNAFDSRTIMYLIKSPIYVDLPQPPRLKETSHLKVA